MTQIILNILFYLVISVVSGPLADTRFFAEFLNNGSAKIVDDKLLFDLSFDIHGFDCGAPDCYITTMQFEILESEVPQNLKVIFSESGCMDENDGKQGKFVLSSLDDNHVNYYSEELESNLYLYRDGQYIYYPHEGQSSVDHTVLMTILNDENYEVSDIAPFRSSMYINNHVSTYLKESLSMKNNYTPTVEAQMLIRKPANEVFEAFVNPEITTKFWFTKSSGKLEEGKRIKWEWEMYNVSADVVVHKVVPNQLISVEWGDPQTYIDFKFSAYSDSTTYVVIKNYGFHQKGEELIKAINDNTGGFTTVLDGLKAYLEHGIELNLIGDKFPHISQK